MPLRLDVSIDPALQSHIEVGLQVRDPQASLSFYVDTLGFTPFGEVDTGSRHLWGLVYGGVVIKFLYDARTANTPMASAI
jgi:catechol 2,3-dioxygenase-like lactoylglutathione lyase family enzyme